MKTREELLMMRASLGGLISFIEAKKIISDIKEDDFLKEMMDNVKKIDVMLSDMYMDKLKEEFS